jgi:feruloyl-CoA synthase
MLWLNLEACNQLLGISGEEGPDATASRITESPKVVDSIRQALQEHNRKNPGSSTRIERFLLLTEPPSIDAHEVTENGYVNQRVALERRKDAVELLYYAESQHGVYVV